MCDKEGAVRSGTTACFSLLNMQAKKLLVVNLGAWPKISVTAYVPLTLNSALPLV